MKRNQKIRFNAYSSPRFLGAGECLSRENAILRVRHSLQQSIQDTEAWRLIGLFSIAAEELSEAGLSYEMLKVLERQALFI